MHSVLCPFSFYIWNFGDQTQNINSQKKEKEKEREEVHTKPTHTSSPQSAKKMQKLNFNILEGKLEF